MCHRRKVQIMMHIITPSKAVQKRVPYKLKWNGPWTMWLTLLLEIGGGDRATLLLLCRLLHGMTLVGYFYHVRLLHKGLWEVLWNLLWIRFLVYVHTNNKYWNWKEPSSGGKCNQPRSNCFYSWLSRPTIFDMLSTVICIFVRHTMCTLSVISMPVYN
jgi:hypothetical protein